ncbi:MAG: L-threonylcarbamoyladenylate synthase [Acidobacteriota bacterium]
MSDVAPPSAGRLACWRLGEPIDRVRRHLDAGGVLAIPTESSYGLAVDPRNPRGVEAIYRLKARDRGNPLPVVVSDIAQLSMLGVDLQDPSLGRLAHHWPAALTWIASIPTPLPATASMRTVAVRVPAHDPLRQLLATLGHPLTATSANLSGTPAVCSIDGLSDLATVGRPQLLVMTDDLGTDSPDPLPGGPPSTLVRWSDSAGRFEVLRCGRFDPALLDASLSE